MSQTHLTKEVEARPRSGPQGASQAHPMYEAEARSRSGPQGVSRTHLREEVEVFAQDIKGCHKG